MLATGVPVSVLGRYAELGFALRLCGDKAIRRSLCALKLALCEVLIATHIPMLHQVRSHLHPTFYLVSSFPWPYLHALSCYT